MAIAILLCLFSCLIGLYRLQTSEFKLAQNQSSALKSDAKHVGKFLILALPFFILLFIFFPALTATLAYSNSRTKKCHGDE